MTTQNAAPLADRTMVLERVFDAPASLVFEAYTNPAHLPHWFGPRGFSCATKSIDLKAGGHWHFDMIAPDGKVWPNYMRFLEIVENEKIVFDHGAEPDGEPHFRTTITFTADGDKTRLRQESLFPTAEAVPVASPLNDIFFGSMLNPNQEDDLLLPIVSDLDY